MANQSKKDPHPTATKEMSFEDGSGAINMGQLDQTNQDLSAQKPRQDFLDFLCLVPLNDLLTLRGPH